MDGEHRAVTGPAGFVIAFYSDGHPQRLRWVREALDSVRRQTDPDVRAFIVVDDQSPTGDHYAEVLRWAAADATVYAVPADTDRGPGRSRNIGVEHAAAAGCPFVCFLDADDLAHPDRAAVVRRVLSEDPDCGAVYTRYVVIDEHGAPVPREALVEGIRLIMEDLETRPLEGYEVWIPLAEGRGNLNIPTAVSVRTELALAIPFPDHVQAHEDTHAWLRYSASGAKIAYRPEIPSSYRVPRNVEGSNIRQRMGGIEAFNRLQAQVILPGLREAIAMARRRGVVDAARGREIEVRYLLSVAATVLKDGTANVSAELVDQARQLSPDDCRRWLPSYDLTPLETSHRATMAAAAGPVSSPADLGAAGPAAVDGDASATAEPDRRPAH